VNKTAGAACDMENGIGQPTGEMGVCTMTLGCGSWVQCGPDASVPVCPDGGVRPGYVYQQSLCLLCKAADAGVLDGAAGSGGAAGSDGAVATGGAAGSVVTGGAAGTAGSVVTGGAAGTAGTGGASGGAGAVALGGSAGATGAGGSAGTGGVTVAPSEPEDEGGCSLGSTTAKKTFGPWLLSGGVAALLLLARRRRRG
jgi:hypothetical protein